MLPVPDDDCMIRCEDDLRWDRSGGYKVALVNYTQNDDDNCGNEVANIHYLTCVNVRRL
jgi:hypothetical protein